MENGEWEISGWDIIGSEGKYIPIFILILKFIMKIKHYDFSSPLHVGIGQFFEKAGSGKGRENQHCYEYYLMLAQM